MPKLLPSARLTMPVGCHVHDGLADELKEGLPGLLDLSGRAAGEAALALGNGVLVVDAALPGALDLVDKLAEMRPQAVLIVLADDLPAGVVRALLRVRASDVLPRRAGKFDIIAAVERLTKSEHAGQPPSAPVWAFIGAVGGAGTTTLAIETACHLGRDKSVSRVCLIDLNLGDGMVAAYLDSRPQLDVSQLGEGGVDRMDANLLQAFTTQHPAGISLVCAPRDPDAYAAVDSDTLLALLDVACATHDHVILDLPRWRQPWSRPILEAVDEVFAVSELTVPSLHAAADLCRNADAMRGPSRETRLVLNRFMQGNSRVAIPRADAERAIRRRIDVTIRSDWESARAAVNLGVPVMGVKPGSPLVKDVADLLDQFAPEQWALAVPAGRR